MRTFNLLVALFAVVQALRYARRALVFVAPAVRVTGEPGEPPRSAPRLRLGAELERLGFVPLGLLHERAPLGAVAREVDAYADASRGTFADVWQERGEADAPRLVFYTPFPDGAYVLTANHPRRAVASARAQAGAVVGAAPEAQLAAHEIAVERFAARHGTPAVALDLGARLAAARAWYAGEGRRELRRGAALPFGIAAFALVLLASAVNLLLHGAR
ncbi:hypothetical protein [Anaeromyxobacter diazotrophicus]|uniref:Uncharacterized protein n=1 Tax=Anaeromyxobacter diazotrophicus TaxID=2590199 RepID=A0A7I9VN37_9BACT|nr:hypothetical protein [Anaeromyxobacter diazotrophicus]GEJ57824.1 hypothetical protein AMYX_25650 [Anaeromyxobacter diazotrophicus]